jgi:hypothetical protein
MGFSTAILKDSRVNPPLCFMLSWWIIMENPPWFILSVRMFRKKHGEFHGFSSAAMACSGHVIHQPCDILGYRYHPMVFRYLNWKYLKNLSVKGLYHADLSNFPPSSSPSLPRPSTIHHQCHFKWQVGSSPTSKDKIQRHCRRKSCTIPAVKADPGVENLLILNVD